MELKLSTTTISFLDNKSKDVKRLLSDEVNQENNLETTKFINRLQVAVQGLAVRFVRNLQRGM